MNETRDYNGSHDGMIEIQVEALRGHLTKQRMA